MLPRRKRAVVLKGSELEKYRNESSVGHWVLVEEPRNDASKEINSFLKKNGGAGRWKPATTGRPPPPPTFAADNVTVGVGSAERFMNVSGRGYVHADGERFAGDPFDRVRAINADDNSLRLATFRTFRSVRRLSLRRNRLQSVEPVDGDLAETLISLDLSENRLGPDDVYRLSASRLEQLFLSANYLTAIPENITDYHCFLSLECLDLSDNRLSRPRTFYLLSTLHNLQTLNLSGNGISFIPYLVTDPPSSDDVERTDGGEDEVYPRDDGDVERGDENGSDELVYRVQHIPFARLCTIDLSNNGIAQAWSLLSLISWPALTNVVLTANAIGLRKNSTAFETVKTTMSEYNINVERYRVTAILHSTLP